MTTHPVNGEMLTLDSPPQHRDEAVSELSHISGWLAMLLWPIHRLFIVVLPRGCREPRPNPGKGPCPPRADPSLAVGPDRALLCDATAIALHGQPRRVPRAPGLVHEAPWGLPNQHPTSHAGRFATLPRPDPRWRGPGHLPRGDNLLLPAPPRPPDQTGQRMAGAEVPGANARRPFPAYPDPNRLQQPLPALPDAGPTSRPGADLPRLLFRVAPSGGAPPVDCRPPESPWRRRERFTHRNEPAPRRLF